MTIRPARPEGVPGSAPALLRGPVLAMALVLAATPASAQTLRDAMTAAFAGNPGLDAERARQRADEELVRQEWAKTLPQVSLDASRGEEKTRTNNATSKTELNPDSYALTLSQPLFRGFQTLNGTRRAKSEVLAGQAKLHEREQKVLLDTVTAYMDVIRDRKVLELRRENVSFLEGELKATRARHRGGDLSRTDVAQAKSRLFEGEADLAQAEADVEVSEATFQAIVGRHPGALSRPELPLPLLPPTLDEAIRMAEQGNPLIVNAVYSQEAARRAKREAYGALLPTVSLDLSHGVEHETGALVDKEEESSIFLRMKMPLFQGGGSYSRIRETKARESGATYEVTDTRRRTRADAIDAWKQFHAAKARISAARQQVSAARDALRGVQIEVKVGERALFEILDAQRELVNAEVALANAGRDHVVSSYRLVASAGLLTARNLALPAAYPDRNRYIRQKNPKLRQVTHRTGAVATPHRPAVTAIARPQPVQPAAVAKAGNAPQTRNAASPPVREGYWLQTVEAPAPAIAPVAIAPVAAPVSRKPAGPPVRRAAQPTVTLRASLPPE